ncbi:MAG: MerR family transcriptional regulator [Propionibacteriaceae bacterium]|nr:MerR family transcriptional regulator [Propionibacteriaceae bacterium]
MSGAARTIGVVLEMIRPEFPDISVSKLRYLETEGLISPDRQQPSGYRRFSQTDVDRLLYVLRAQRDRYLPLKVIREELEAIDRGEEPSTVSAPPVEEPAEPKPQTQRRAGGPGLMARRQVMAESGLGEAALIQLERLRIIQPRRGSQLYGPEAVALAQAAKKLGDYGVDLRQMRVLQQAAAMEAALVEQVLDQYRRRPGPPPEVVRDLYRAVLQAHAALLHGQIH